MFKGLFNITVIAEYVTFVAAVALLGKNTGQWRLFILFLLFVVTVETCGWYAIVKLNIRNNAWMFNMLLVVNICFCTWMLSLAEPMHPLRTVIGYVFGAVIIFTVTNIIFFDGFKTYNSYTEILFDIVLSIISCYLFFQTLKEEQYRNLFRYEYFWLANGLLVFSLGSAVLSSGSPQLALFRQHTGIKLSGYLNDTINVLLYSCFIIAFVCRKMNTK